MYQYTSFSLSKSYIKKQYYCNSANWKVHFHEHGFMTISNLDKNAFTITCTVNIYTTFDWITFEIFNFHNFNYVFSKIKKLVWSYCFKLHNWFRIMDNSGKNLKWYIVLSNRFWISFFVDDYRQFFTGSTQEIAIFYELHA